MPVTADDFLWQNTGFMYAGTSTVVTHPDAGGTTAGTTVVVAVYHTALTLTLPAGFTRITSSSAWVQLAFKENVSGGETSWTFTSNSTADSAWSMFEVDNLSIVDPMDDFGSTSPTTIANGATKSTGQTFAANSSSSGVVLAFFGAAKVGVSDVQSWSGYTNSYTEVFDVAPPGGTAGRQLACARKFIENVWTTHETTATFATSAANAAVVTSHVVLRSADASINAPLTGVTGFKWNTHAGMGNTATVVSGGGRQGSPTGAEPAVGTFGTGYQVTGGRLKLTAAGTAPAVPIYSAHTARFACGFNVEVESVTGEAVIAHVVCSGTDLEVLYDAATTKVGVRWAGGTAVWQTGTTALGQEPWIDLRLSPTTSVHHADWSISTGTGDGSQTAPADLTGQSPGSSVQLYLGCPAAETFVAYYTNVVTSTQYAAYPLGPHTVHLLVPETTGATVSGTSSNFSKFTANGTLAAWAGDAGALLDEVPPTISASSDGVVQTAVAASDYANFPMTTYTLASDEIIAGVRFVASLWGGTGTGTGTIGWRGHDGTSETSLIALSASFDPDSLTTASATYPIWHTRMWAGGVNGAWTQARLNAAAIRMGFSTDATPDMGASAVYLEVATKTLTAVRTLTVEDGAFTADIYVNPYHSGTVSYVITNNDPTRTAQFDYSVSGTPQTPVTVAPGAGPTTVDIHAEAFGDISDCKLTEA